MVATRPTKTQTLYVHEDDDGLLIDGRPAFFKDGRIERRLTRDRQWGRALVALAKGEGDSCVSVRAAAYCSAMLRFRGIKAVRSTAGKLALSLRGTGSVRVVWGRPPASP